MRTNMRSLPLLLMAIFAFCVFEANGQSQENWKTHAERTNYRETPRYAETVGFAKQLAEFSPDVEYKVFGLSSEGRELPLLVLDKKSSSKTSGGTGRKPVILIQAGIHSGESDGKDAGLALLRDIVVTGSLRELSDNATILFIPVLNVDGHEMWSRTNRINQNGPEFSGFRANSANLNLNRDYLKADTPEIRAWLSLWNEWNPDFFIDCHVTDGADYRFNITWEYARHAEAPAPIRDWMRDHFEGPVVQRVEAKGNLLSPYIQLADRTDPTKGIFTFIATPRYATGYSPLRNRVGLLIEAHSLKDYGNRVKGTYDLLVEMIREIGKNADSLLAANAQADAGAKRLAGKPLPLQLRIAREPSRNFQFKGVEVGFEESAISGTKKLVYGTRPFDAVIPWYDKADVSEEINAPDFYIVPPQWREVVERIKAHGIEYSVIEEEEAFEIETYVFDEPKWAAAPFEGRITLSSKMFPLRTRKSFPKGSLVIPVSQPAGAVVIHLLEPAGPDSFFYWGFFNSIFERKEYAETYMLEKLAEKMLAENPGLKEELDEKLKEESFAKDPRKRLDFFYERSGFKEVTGIYPVGRFFGSLR